MDEFVVIGKIGATFGIKGWLKIQSFTENKFDITEFFPWFIEQGNKWKEIEIEETRDHGKIIIAKFVGINNPEDARLLTGKKIAIPSSQLPTLKKNEYYWRDLEGLTVKNKNGEILGTLIYLMKTGGNDVMVIKNDKEYAIPYLPDTVVISVDLKERVIVVDWELI